jgi:hypothetical protein
VMLPLRKWVEKVAKRHLPGQEEAGDGAPAAPGSASGPEAAAGR